MPDIFPSPCPATHRLCSFCETPRPKLGMGNGNRTFSSMPGLYGGADCRLRRGVRHCCFTLTPDGFSLQLRNQSLFFCLPVQARLAAIRSQKLLAAKVRRLLCLARPFGRSATRVSTFKGKLRRLFVGGKKGETPWMLPCRVLPCERQPVRRQNALCCQCSTMQLALLRFEGGERIPCLRPVE